MTVDDGDMDAVTAAAVAWHLRLPTANAADWQAFTIWLEADPSHAAAYDTLALSDAELDEALSPAEWSDAPSAANDRRPTRRRWIWGAVGGLAAAGMAGFMLPMVNNPEPTLRIVETPAGARRAVMLADGSRIELNGDTRVALDEGTTRLVTLERGEALFRVKHDAARPFVVQSGDLRLQDVGTVFNVSRVGTHLGVQVAEGAVLFQPDRDRIMLTAGAALSHIDGGTARMSKIAKDDVGSWQQGRLTFQRTPMRLVAAALERSIGDAIDVAPDLAETPFTGSIGISGDADRMAPRIAALIGARAVHRGGRWTLARGENSDP